MDILLAKMILNDYLDDDEVFHSKFDNIIEKRLMELDPKFMRAMKKIYKKSELNRWCA